MNIPTGYAILTAGLVAVCVVALVVAGWSHKKAAISAALGVCVLTSIFVTDVITNGTVMNARLAGILVAIGVLLMVPLAFAARGSAKRPANPPDTSARR